MKDIYLVSMVKVSLPDNATERVEKVLAYMSQHCEDATLASVSAHFNFHPNTVSGMIKRETGKSFGDMLREIRMQRALSLLEAGTLSIAQVAQLCGYENPSNFYRVFKDTFGMTPRAYMARREAGEQVLDPSMVPQPAQFMEIDSDDDAFGDDMVRSAGAADSVVLFGEGDADLDLDEDALDAEGAAGVQASAEASAAGEQVRVPSASVRGGASVTIRPDAQATQRPHGPGARTWRDEPTAPEDAAVDGQQSGQEQGLS